MRAAMFRASLAGLTLLGLAACITPNPPPPAPSSGPFPTAAVPDTPIEAASGAYTLDHRHTSVVWRVRHTGLSLYTARFDMAAGALTLDATAPAKSTLSVAIDANSISTGLKDDKGQLSFDREIARGLGAEKTPKITFVSRAITRTGEKTGLILGDLTMNGVTKPMTLEATFESYVATSLLSPKPEMAFSAHALIKRSDWGVTAWSLFAGDDVEIIIQSEFQKD